MVRVPKKFKILHHLHGSFFTVPATAKIMFWQGAGLKFLVSIVKLTAVRMWSYSVKMAV